MSPKNPTRVLAAGGFSPTDWNVAGARVEHSNHPGWLFTVDVSLRDGRLLGLHIEPTTNNATATGIQTALLRSFPISDIVAAVRHAHAENFLAWNGSQRVRAVEVDEHGRAAVRFADLAPDPAMRKAMREIAEPIRQNPRKRGRTHRLTDHFLAVEMQAYSEAVTSGELVWKWLQKTHRSRETFRDHRDEAVRRGLFVSNGSGRAGGKLTSQGEQALRAKE